MQLLEWLLDVARWTLITAIGLFVWFFVLYVSVRISGSAWFRSKRENFQ